MEDNFSEDQNTRCTVAETVQEEKEEEEVRRPENLKIIGSLLNFR